MSRARGTSAPERPLLGTPTINGLSIFGRRGSAKQLNTSGYGPTAR